MAGTPPSSRGSTGAPTDAQYVTGAASADLSAELILGSAVVMSGLLSARPAASLAGLLYLATDVNGGTLYRDTGAAWVQVAMGARYSAFLGQAGVLVPTARGWTTAANAFTANRVFATRFVLPVDFTVTSLVFRSVGAGTGNVDVGIYNTSLARLASSGSTAGKKGANTTQSVALSASVALTAGTVYYAALESDTSDGTFGGAVFGQGVEQFFGSTVGLTEGMQKDTTFPLPDPLVTPASTTIVPIAALV